MRIVPRVGNPHDVSSTCSCLTMERISPLSRAWRASYADKVWSHGSTAGTWYPDGNGWMTCQRATRDRGFGLIPVLLPGLPEPFEPSAVLPPFLSTRTWVDLRQGIGNSARLEPLVRAIKGIAQGPVAESSHAEGPPPYRGLDRFEEEHADLFFGRAPDVQRLLEKLKVSRFLAVVAPSGCGKSSLVRAGLLPAIRAGELSDSETWAVRVMTPGASPLDALSTWVAQLGRCGGWHRSGLRRRSRGACVWRSRWPVFRRRAGSWCRYRALTA